MLEWHAEGFRAVFGKTAGRIDPDAETKECVIFGAIHLITGCGCLYVFFFLFRLESSMDEQGDF